MESDGKFLKIWKTFKWIGFVRNLLYLIQTTLTNIMLVKIINIFHSDYKLTIVIRTEWESMYLSLCVIWEYWVGGIAESPSEWVLHSVRKGNNDRPCFWWFSYLTWEGGEKKHTVWVNRTPYQSACLRSFFWKLRVYIYIFKMLKTLKTPVRSLWPSMSR